MGYTIHFHSTPSPFLMRSSYNRRYSLLLLGAIELVPLEFVRRGFYSSYFLVLKRHRMWRPILNFRNLNNYILAQHFGTVTLATIIPFLDLEDWFVALDLQDVCFVSHPPFPQVFSTLCNRIRSLPILSPPLRVLHGLEGLYKDPLSHSSLPLSLEHGSIPILGQLADQRPVRPTASVGNLQSTTYSNLWAFSSVTRNLF